MVVQSAEVESVALLQAPAKESAKTSGEAAALIVSELRELQDGPQEDSSIALPEIRPSRVRDRDGHANLKNDDNEFDDSRVRLHFNEERPDYREDEREMHVDLDVLQHGLAVAHVRLDPNLEEEEKDRCD